MKRLSLEQLKLDVKNCWTLTHIAEREINLVDFVNEEYIAKNTKVIKNNFIKYSGLLHYHSAVLKMYALFGNYTWTNTNSLHKYITFRDQWPNAKDIEDVEYILKCNTVNTTEIKYIRDKVIAHHDFDDFPNVHYNLELLDCLKECYILQK